LGWWCGGGGAGMGVKVISRIALKPSKRNTEKKPFVFLLVALDEEHFL
jgi:hypothetical protein